MSKLMWGMKLYRNIEITLKGETEDDLEFALETVLKLIKDGNVAGQDRNETSCFSFNVRDGEQ